MTSKKISYESRLSAYLRRLLEKLWEARNIIDESDENVGAMIAADMLIKALEEDQTEAERALRLLEHCGWIADYYCWSAQSEAIVARAQEIRRAAWTVDGCLVRPV